MSLDTAIHDKLFGRICLPMTHDTGTFDLSNTIVDPTWQAVLDKYLPALAGILNEAHLRPYNTEPMTWLLSVATAALKGLVATTSQNVAAQLNGGIRGFDFRLLNVAGIYYTYHGFQSTSTFGSMLDDIRAFLIATTQPGVAVGEIVYVNLSHYSGFGDDDYAAFGVFVKSKLGDFAYRRDSTGGMPDPFLRTYGQIIGQGGEYKSRAILVSQVPLGDDDCFWPVEYCPPVEYRNDHIQPVLAGRYTETTDIPTMISTQASQFQDAVTGGLPFANFMTLTPDQTQFENIVGAALYDASLQLEDVYIRAGNAAAADVVRGIVELLLPYKQAVDLLGWATLQELSLPVISALPEIIDDNFLTISGRENRMSMIFCDFWEESQLVALSISLSNDLASTWSGGGEIKFDGKNLESSEGPVAAMYNGQLYMVYKGNEKNYIHLAVYDPSSATWISNQKIKDMPRGDIIDPETTKSPAVVVWNHVLNIVWKKAGSSSIHSAWWNGSYWSGGGAITIPSPGENPETNEGPALALYGDGLVMVHKNKDNNYIDWEQCNADGVWSGGHRIVVSDHPDSKYPQTNKRPALVEYNGLLYLLYKGGNTENILQSTFDGTDWKGNNVVLGPDITSEGPGPAQFQGGIFMFDKGAELTPIWISMFYGQTWSPIQYIKDISKIEPTTTKSPWAVRAGLDLILLFKGEYTGRLHQAMLSPIT